MTIHVNHKYMAKFTNGDIVEAASASAKLQGYSCLKEVQIDVIVALIKS